MSSKSSISFSVNFSQYTVSIVDPKTSLNSWLRSQAGLTGTKWMCGEGGCGSCMVLLQHPLKTPKAVNSVSFLYTK